MTPKFDKLIQIIVESKKPHKKAIPLTSKDLIEETPKFKKQVRKFK
jgi:hypothetical protein